MDGWNERLPLITRDKGESLKEPQSHYSIIHSSQDKL